ncbi:MAG: acyl-CoA dehydrogenase family protein, partial [Kiloniellales bacterium]
MHLALSAEQKLLQDSVERFIDKEYPFPKRRELVASPDGFSREFWAKFAELGWLGIAVPAAYGGLEGTPVETMIVMQAFGRGLVVEPYLTTAVLGRELLQGGAGRAHKRVLLPALVEGRLMLAFAYAEPGSRYDLAHVETGALKDGRGFVLNGHKAVVFHADTADKLIVSARTAGGARDRDGISLFLVDREAKGLGLRPYPTVDGLRAAEVTLDHVHIKAESVLGPLDGGLMLIERAIDHAIAAVCAEAVGAMTALVSATHEYLKTRTQFGVPIGSFQVLQHRLVDMFMEQELSKSASYMAAAGVSDQDAMARARAVSAAKARIGKAGRFIGQQAIQLHGGMGITDELPVGHYFKRLTMIDRLFGDRDHHLRRLANLP